MDFAGKLTPGDALGRGVSGESKAVFLSYSSEDTGAAASICQALRAAGIEVWFDKSELRGGDAWDLQIREQIHDCRLFIPVISANTEGRDEGYFRREWSLAADRTRDMAHRRAFIVPVVIDGTSERGASVPEKFRELQWTRLPEGKAPPAFVERIRSLLGDAAFSTTNVQGADPGHGPMPTPSPGKPSWLRAVGWGAGALTAVAVTCLLAFRLQPAKPPPPAAPVVAAAQQPAVSTLAAAAFNPPPHSIAVLPFVNMSGDKEQEYFSDGLTEELLNALARINELQVSARTSSFAFKGKNVDIGTIARQLNVGAILEGSVRRSGHRVRVTAQLNNAVTGFHLWSQSYDRDLGDVLKLESDIAGSVVRALKVTLLSDAAARIEIGGTRNPAALDAYLRGMHTLAGANNGTDLLNAISGFTDAARLDPGYAQAFAARSLIYNDYAANWATGSGVQEGLRKAEADARRALALAPDLALAHLALADLCVSTFELQCADDEYARAGAIEPGDVTYLMHYGLFATQMGRTEAGLAATRQAIRLDPVSAGPHAGLGYVLYLARQHEEALAAYERELILAPDDPAVLAYVGLADYALGRLEAARASCAREVDQVDTLVCLAVTYNRLGRNADARSTLAKFMKLRGDADAYAYAEIYAQWGDTISALGWLDKAVRLRDTGLILLKTDPLMDPLRHEPRFQAALKALQFPD